MEIENAEKPAFAAVCYTNDGSSGYLLEGLTKREYFAGLAMQGFLAKYGTDYQPQHARESVYMADALLLELSKTE